MNINDLKPAYLFAQQYGVKSLVHGFSGSGKTPISNTAPRPVMCVMEPGMLSMRNSNIPVWQAFTSDAIDDFFDWLFTSNERNNFDTVIIDSASQMAETYLTSIETGKSRSGNKMHGKAAYGEMSRRTYDKLWRLYFLQNMHTYIICKQGWRDVDGIVKLSPYFPGQDLNIKVPHLYDLVLHCGITAVPNVGNVRAFRTREAINIIARDRSGNLDEFEQCNLAALFAKAMR